MIYSHAIKETYEGKTFSRESWNGKWYIKLLENHIWRVNGETARTLLTYMPDDDDTNATDWVEYDPPILKAEAGRKEKKRTADYIARQKRGHEFAIENGHWPNEDEFAAIDKSMGYKQKKKGAVDSAYTFEGTE